MDQDPNTANTANTFNPANPAGSLDVNNQNDLTAAQPQPQLQQPQTPKSPQRRKKIILISSIAGAVALILAGLAVWFFIFYNNPQKVLFDGIGNILRAPNVALQGGGSIALRAGKTDDTIKSATLNFNSSSSKLPNATDASLFVELADGQKLNLQLGTVQMSDGVIYLKISGLMEGLRALGLDSAAQSSMEELIKVAEIVDGDWWRISVRDALRDASGSEEISGIYGDLYDCALRASTRDNSQTILNLFNEHQFVDVTPIKKINSPDAYSDYTAVAWHNLYEIKFKSAELAAFLNALPRTAVADEMYTCYNSALARYYPDADQISADDATEFSAADLQIPENLHFYIESSPFTHKIRSVWAYSEDENWNNSLAVVLSYQAAEVTPPSEYRDIAELFQELSLENLWTDLSENSPPPTDSGDDEILDSGDDLDFVYDETDEIIITNNETEAI